MKRAVSVRSLLAICFICGQASAAPPMPPAAQALVDHISADSLKRDVQYLASGELAGRGAGSRGVDQAADYIAAQFRQIGLVPAGNDGYFQTAAWSYAERDARTPWLTIEAAGQSIALPNDAVTMHFHEPLKLAGVPLRMSVDEALAAAAGAADGKVLVVPVPEGKGSYEIVGRLRALKSKPAAIVLLDREHEKAGTYQGWLVDPEAPAPRPSSAHYIVVHSAELFARLQGQPLSAIRIDAPAPTARPTTVRNVIGVLPGSDPALSKTYVMLTAHYDHLGVVGGEAHPGANDDASGTASVIEIARAMASLKERPRRSIVFMAVFGEEGGLLGSRFYGRHPVFPLAATVADLNLEQVGRTDDSEGRQVAAAALTGFDYSTVAQTLQRAGEMTGLAIVQRAPQSDMYFSHSDNQSLADQGVPAHTLSVAYDFPDYHDVGDTPDKLDYANMAQVDRTAALALYLIAQDPQAPVWNATNPKAAKYAAAARLLGAAPR